MSAEDWIRHPVDEFDERAARERAAAQNERDPFDEETFWIGYLGENMVADWMVAGGLGVTLNGGVDELPDVAVEGYGGVEVKTQVIRRGAFQPSYEVGYLAAGLRRPTLRAIVFCAYEVDPRQLVILGGRSPEGYFTEARFVPNGGALASGAPTRGGDSFQLAAARLVTPAALLTTIEKERST